MVKTSKPLPSSSEAVRSIGLAISILLGKLVCALMTWNDGSCSGSLLLRRILTPGIIASTLLYLSLQGGILLTASRAVQDSIAPLPFLALNKRERELKVCWAVDEKSQHESARDGDVRNLSKLAMSFAVHLPCDKHRASRFQCAAFLLS